MIAVGKRNIKEGREFDRLFSKPKGENLTVKKRATLSDTISLMKQVVSDTLDDTRQIAKRLQGTSERNTCKRIWDFCFSHFQYKKDEERKEQVRRPSRSWWDRKTGIDCDCMTVFIGSVLTNLGIPFKMRMTRYKALDFEHIYPVAETDEGEVIIDCVVHKFNYEVPYTQKKDIEMELQYLNGVPGERFNEFGDKITFEHDLPIDAEDLFLHDMELEGLEGRAERKARQAKRKARRADRKANPGKFRQIVKKGLHAINKVNPATALLRAGVLASMKLNVFKVASHLRFAYWTPEEARKNDMDMAKFGQLQRIRQKMEKIFFGAGGKPENLKKAILAGKGNRNKMVRLNGLGEIIDNISDHDDLRTILGEDIFEDELNGIQNVNGFGALGAIATGAAVAAASGVMGTIAGLIKKLGGLFKKGSKAGQMFKIQDNTDNAEEKTRKFSVKNLFNKVKSKIQQRRMRKAQEQADAGTGDEVLTDETLPTEEYTGEDDFSDMDTNTRSQEFDIDADTGDDGGGSDSEKKGVIQWVKDNPIPTALIGLGVAGGTFLAVRAIKKSKSGKGLSGVPKKKKKKTGTKAKKTAAVRRKTSTRRKPSVRKKTTRKRKATSRIRKVELL